MRRDAATCSIESDLDMLKRAGLDSAARVLALQAADTAALSRSSDTFPVELTDDDGEARCVFVKRYRYDRWSQRLRLAFRGTLLGVGRARAEFDFLSEMRRRGVSAVCPLVTGELRMLGFVRGAFLITRGEPGVASLDNVVSQDFLTGENRRRHRVLAIALGKSIGAMHRAGVRHGGLYWRNILVRDNGDSFAISFLDPDRRGRFFDGSVSFASVESDLVEFFASAAAAGVRGYARRFLSAYTDAFGQSMDVRQLTRALVRKSQSQIASECHRLAIAQIISRIRRGSSGDNAGSIDAFLDQLSSCASGSDSGACGRRVIRFEFEDTEPTLVVFENGRYAVSKELTSHADLTVSVDPAVWLAVVNAQPDAFDLVRRRGIRITGSTPLLARMLRDLST